MSTANHFDVVIVGTGAGGATLAYALARSGKRILLLERGDFLPREKDNWDTKAIYQYSKYRANDVWHDDAGRQIHPNTYYVVGGNTKVYGAALMRLRKEDFGELRHYEGISPAWPITYEEFEPFYTQAEYLYHVHGERGEDSTEPFASAPYRHPALRHESRVAQLFDALRRIGRTPFALPLAVLFNERDQKASPCIRCGTCDGYPCFLGAKADGEVIAVGPALTYPNVQLHTRTYVERLLANPSGREVTKLVARRDGEIIEYSADLVVLAGGAINSAALLLRSASERHPHGLANSSGLVGRYYMRHNCSVVLAVSRVPNPTVFQQTVALNDFYFGSDDWKFPMGNIQLIGKSTGVMLKSQSKIPLPVAVFDLLTRHAIDFWVMSEDLPDSDNRITIDSGGQPVLHYRDNNLEAHRRLIRKLNNLLSAIRKTSKQFEWLFPLAGRVPVSGIAHHCGTLRFGHSARTSVLDTNCKTHDLDNLYVVDGSFFVSSGAVNPGLTIMANALRVGEHLRDRLG